mgnify:CR=1 FL=1
MDLTTNKNKSSFKFNPFDPEFHANPYPAYQQLRSREPVHQHFLGSWGLTRYADVKAILRHPQIRSDNLPQRLQNKNNYLEHKSQNLNALVQVTSTWLLSLEPPDHTRIRKLVGKAFSPVEIERLRPKVQQIVDDLIDKVQQNGSMDIISDIARPLPVRVISMMLGIPEETQSQVDQWANDLSGILDPLNSLETLVYMDEVVLKFSKSLEKLILEREQAPKRDLISAFIAARDEGDKLNHNELLTTCMLLFGTGEETTVNLIGNGMLALFHHPNQMELLKHEPNLIQSAVEEFARYDSPIQRIARVALEDVEIGNQVIHAGEQLILYLGAANRDPAQFLDADRLDITRTDNYHLAYADGIHYCLGAALAKLEAQVAINTLIQRLPDLQLQTDKLEWRKNIALRGLKSLPVKFNSSQARK